MNDQDFKACTGELAELNPDALLADGFEEALIGYAVTFNKTTALYDYKKCLEILMERDGLDLDEAQEHMVYNVIGSYVGEGTPTFAHLYDPD